MSKIDQAKIFRKNHLRNIINLFQWIMTDEIRINLLIISKNIGNVTVNVIMLDRVKISANGIAPENDYNRR